MKKLISMACIQYSALFGLNAPSTADYKILHLDWSQSSDLNPEALVEQLNTFNFIVLTNLDKSEQDLNGELLNEMIKNHPFYYQIEESDDKVLLSFRELSHVKIGYLDENNYFIEVGHESMPKLFIYGYLPHISNENIDTLKSFYMANNPCIQGEFSGDFETVYLFDRWELCKKRSVSLETEADTKGNAAASGKLKVESDDKKTSASVSVEVKKNEKGEKEASVKVKATHNW